MWAALKWGVLVGVGIYVLDRLALTWLATALFGPGVPSLDNPALFSSLCLGIFALLFAFSAAGYFAGRETARPGMGAVAGAVAFVVYAALSALYSPSSAPPAPPPGATGMATAAAQATATAIATHAATVTATATPGAQALPAPNPAVLLAANVTSFLLVAGIAALMGWLGGRPGAQQARKRQAAKAGGE